MSDGIRRILFYSEGWGEGGIETFVMNVAGGLDPERYEFEIFCTHDWSNCHDAAIADLGGVRHVVFRGDKPSLLKRFFAGARAFRGLVRERHFDIVHVNTMNGFGFAYAQIAKRAGIPVRVVHSHNSDFGEGSRAAKTLAHRLGRVLWGKSATSRVACSQISGRHLFGDGSFQVVRNSIDAERFRFDASKRQEVRDSLCIDADDFVIGFVGRLENQKNPLFLLGVLAAALEKESHALLFVIGEGRLGDAFDGKARDLGVSDRIVRLSRTDDVPGCMSAMDVLCAPSLFEGLSLVTVEAQASGLPVVDSLAIPPEAAVTDLVEFLDLEAGVDRWAEALLACRGAACDRASYADAVARSGYGLDCLRESVERLYEGCPYSKGELL